jgi:hypothetical protein
MDSNNHELQRTTFNLCLYWRLFAKFREDYLKDKEEAIMKKILKAEKYLTDNGIDVARLYVDLQYQGLDIPDAEDVFK